MHEILGEIAGLRLIHACVRPGGVAQDKAVEVGSFDLEVVTGRPEWDERLGELFGYRPGQFPGDLAAWHGAGP